MVAKVKLYEHFKIYAGAEFSMDGLTALFGFKIAGIKMLFPYVGVEKYQ
jgi:hypothetical protein